MEKKENQTRCDERVKAQTKLERAFESLQYQKKSSHQLVPSTTQLVPGVVEHIDIEKDLGTCMTAAFVSFL